MGSQLIRLTAMTGHRVRVYVYDTVEEMRAAGKRFNGNDQDGAWGLTQAYADADGRIVLAIIRLCRESLGYVVVSHEVHHAALAIYGATAGHRVSARAHLNHYNESAAHLFSELYKKLTLALYRRGFYDSKED